MAIMGDLKSYCLGCLVRKCIMWCMSQPCFEHLKYMSSLLSLLIPISFDDVHRHCGILSVEFYIYCVPSVASKFPLTSG
jgi:hypothetical protein